MKWTTEKIELLKDGFAYSDLNELAKKIGTTRGAIIKKAQMLQLRRAKNNQIVDGYKFCSLCKIEHPIEHFYRNKAKFHGLEYYCKKYYETKDTTLAPSKSMNLTEKGIDMTEKTINQTEKGMNCTDYIHARPRNPVIIKDGIEGKVCNGCHTWKPLEDYGGDSKGIAKKRARCRTCYRSKSRRV